MSFAPIVLFVYNRPEHTRKTLEALKNNTLANQSDLIIFSDAPKTKAHAEKVQEVRDYISQIDGFNSLLVVERSSNFGLSSSIIDGVTSVVKKYKRVIVLEDDLVTSPYFLQYMNDGLNVYESNENVASIHGYIYPIDGLPEMFFLKGADCWGWATWESEWALFEADGRKLLKELQQKRLINQFDYNGSYSFSKMLTDQVAGKNNSWAVRWYASTFLKNKYTLYVGKSLVLNIGNDGSGTHKGETNVFSSKLEQEFINIISIPVEENKYALHKIETYFNERNIGIIEKILLFVSKYFKRIFN